MRFLVDTNVVSGAVKAAPDQRVIDWLSVTDESRIYLSAVTIGEIRRGLELVDDGARRDHLVRWLEQDLARRFTGRILSAHFEIFDVWGRLTARERLAGRTLSILDGIIAATAHVHGLTVVTRNIRHFETLGLDLLDPWAA